MGEEGVKDEQKKTVVIRGVEEDIYRRISEFSKKTNKTVGEIATQAFKLYLALVEIGGKIASHTIGALKGIGEKIEKATSMLVVRDLEELELTRRDLEEAGEPVVIIGVKKLTIGGGVDLNTFNEKVREIVDVDSLEIPDALPKLAVLSKCRFVKRISVRKVEE